MKHILLEDGDFKLEATEDNYDNVRITHTFKQGIHTDVDEILLPQSQQHALKDYLIQVTKSIETHLINVVPESIYPSQFYVVVDREHDVINLSAVNYDFSYTMSISRLSRDADNFQRINMFNAEIKAQIVQQIIKLVL